MPITLMYITNNTSIAAIAQNAGVDRIWIDMEYKGKEVRQSGMNTVKSNHTVEDVKRLRPVLTSSSLQVRINPLDNDSEKEINDVIAAGADYIMLPMFRTKIEVERFISLVGGRAKTILLLETADAAKNLESYVDLPGIDEIHIGLNDLHLDLNKKFMFELLSDGTVDRLASILRKHGVKFGFGGIARLGYGMLPAEYVICEHYRLGSSAAILSRSFANSNNITDMDELARVFETEIAKIREFEKTVSELTADKFEENRLETIKFVNKICEGIEK